MYAGRFPKVVYFPITNLPVGVLLKARPQNRLLLLENIIVIALSHIHVSAAYRSRIYENVDTPRSEPYFARETYVPRTCDVPATFPWRIRDVSVFV